MAHDLGSLNAPTFPVAEGEAQEFWKLASSFKVDTLE